MVPNRQVCDKMPWEQVSEYKGKFNLFSELFYCGIGGVACCGHIEHSFLLTRSVLHISEVQCGTDLPGVRRSRSNHRFPFLHKPIPISSNHYMQESGLASRSEECNTHLSDLLTSMNTHFIHSAEHYDLICWLFSLVLPQINLEQAYILRGGIHTQISFILPYD